MRKAIIFHSRTGSVHKCVQRLKEEIQDIDIIDLANIKKNEDKISDYDLIIFGGAFYYAKFSRKVRNYIKKHVDKLENKKYAIFACCVLEEQYKETLAKQLGEELVKNAIINECFGYEISISNAKGFTKWMLKLVARDFRKADKPLIDIKAEKIENFAGIINSVQKSNN